MKTRFLFSLAALAVFVLASSVTMSAAPCSSAYVTGDVFSSVGSATVDVFTPTGSLICTLNDGTGTTFTTGLAFDPTGNLYVTNFGAGNISKFNNSGTLVASSWASNTSLQSYPESIAYNATTTSFFTGGPDNNVITEYNTAGGVTKTFTGLLGGATGGTDWVDFQNASTILYIGEGTSIDSLNINTSANAAFATLPTYSYALRVIPTGTFAGDILVAGSSAAYLLNSTGTVLKTYTLPGNDGSDFALNLDPNGTDFWTSDPSGEVWEINIATGAIDEQWNDGASGSTFGLGIFGEATTVNGGGGGGTGVPEPGSLSLLACGLVAIGGLTKLRRRHA